LWRLDLLTVWAAWAMDFDGPSKPSVTAELRLSEPNFLSRDLSHSLENKVSELCAALRGRVYQYLLVAL
jgi:hypothetical protein